MTVAGTSPLHSLLDEPLGVRHKAFPPALASVRVRDVGDQGLNLARGDLLLPALALRERALEHNIATMATWCRRHDVSLAPHGKTTMAPQLFHRQLAAGAWAITAATAHQAAVMRDHGVRRVLIANEVVDPAGQAWIAEVLRSDPTFELFCLVDSAEGVELLDAALARVGARRALPVLIELGVPGGRAGARSAEGAADVAAAVVRSAHLEAAGVECFEGVLGPGRDPHVVSQVDAMLERVRELTVQLDGAGTFDHATEVVLTAGGSVFFDRVAELRAVRELRRPTRVVLRSGCYVTHDSGVYDQLSPLGSHLGAGADGRLTPALELWSAVLSRPEPGLAILGFGKRDAPYDSGLPTPLRIISSTAPPRPAGPGVEVTSLDDQHAFLRVADDVDLRVGDRVVCGISHPCTAFDKWSLLPVVDEHDDVVGAVRTLF